MKLTKLHESAAGDFRELLREFLEENGYTMIWTQHGWGLLVLQPIAGGRGDRRTYLNTDDRGEVKIKITDDSQFGPTGRGWEIEVYSGTVNLHEPGSLQKILEIIRTPW